jgi:hypothetical protein
MRGYSSQDAARHGISSDLALRDFVHDFWRSMKPERISTLTSGSFHRRDTLISPIDDDSSIMLSEYELGSVDTDALLSVVLDRSLLDFGFDYTCFASLDNKLLLSPLDAFADVCWIDATTQLSRSVSQPLMRRVDPTAVTVAPLSGTREDTRPQSHPARKQASALLYRDKSIPSSRVPRSVSIDDYERDDWYDESDEGSEEVDDDSRSVTPTPSLCYSDDSIRDDGDADMPLYIEEPSDKAQALSPSISPKLSPLPPSPEQDSSGFPSRPSPTIQRRPPPKRVPVPVYTPNELTAVEAHYQARGRQPSAYMPSSTGPRYMDSPRVPTTPSPGKIQTSLFGHLGAASRVQAQERPIAAW